MELKFRITEETNEEGFKIFKTGEDKRFDMIWIAYKGQCLVKIDARNNDIRIFNALGNVNGDVEVLKDTNDCVIMLR